MLNNWEKLPKEFKNIDVKKYYNILKKKKVSIFLKRVFDVICSLILILLFLPLMLIVSLLIKIDSKGPVFYRQERITKYNKKFRIFKFRTMISDADKKGPLVTIKNDNRITRIGKLIRKLRIDEIPQLINILIGDMTFVGTRPEVEKYVCKYTDEMYSTLLLPAGLTSYASIMYRNEDEIIKEYLKKETDVDKIYLKYVLPEKMKYNIKYISKFNILYDIKILVDTVLYVLSIKKL